VAARIARRLPDLLLSCIAQNDASASDARASESALGAPHRAESSDPTTASSHFLGPARSRGVHRPSRRRLWRVAWVDALYKKRYSWAAKRRIKKQPFQVEYKIPVRIYSWQGRHRPESWPWRTDPVTKASVVHDLDDERFQFAIQAFDELGYRLDHEYLSQSLGASGSGGPILTPAITLVFVPKEWDMRPEYP
jgi:hypothetical protein